MQSCSSNINVFLLVILLLKGHIKSSFWSLFNHHFSSVTYVVTRRLKGSCNRHIRSFISIEILVALGCALIRLKYVWWVLNVMQRA